MERTWQISHHVIELGSDFWRSRRHPTKPTVSSRVINLLCFLRLESQLYVLSIYHTLETTVPLPDRHVGTAYMCFRGAQKMHLSGHGPAEYVKL